MKHLFLLLVALYAPVVALDEVRLSSEKDLRAATTIAVGEFSLAADLHKVTNQFRFIRQIRDVLIPGIRSAGFLTTDGVDSARPPDLVLEGKFIEFDNKGAATVVSMEMTLKSYRTGAEVLYIKNKQSSFAGDFVDQMRNLTDEQGNAVVQYFRQWKKEHTSSITPKTAAFSCKDLASSKLVFCALYSPSIRTTANIISVELQKWIQKSKVPMSKINYSIDTTFQRLYAQAPENTSYEALPEEIRTRLQSEGVGYCLLMYDFKDRAPGGTKVRKGAVMTTTIMAPSGGVMVTGTFGQRDKLGSANNFNSIYCRLNLISVASNTSLVSDALWADKEECDDEVVECLVDMIKMSLSEFDAKRNKKVQCWR